MGGKSHPIRSVTAFVCQLVFVVFRSVTVVARHCASNVILNEFEIMKQKRTEDNERSLYLPGAGGCDEQIEEHFAGWPPVRPLDPTFLVFFS